MKEVFNITIGRQFGSGGREIGDKLAVQLGISFYDKELIHIASRKSGLGKEYFEKADERKSYPIISGMLGMRSAITDDAFSGYYLSNETLFKIQSDVILELSEETSSVFVGRCADYVLGGKKRCLNVFISADMKDRIKRISETYNLTGKKAADLIEKTDKKRAGYYNYFSNKEWGAAGSYHLCVNSSVLGIDDTVNVIRHFAEKLFGL